ncbi:MAG TPA: hypothetical protein VGN80_12295 [Devosiaceae bacterium]|jgi:hypothetical protein|nr:hypothetical protein [Devosiaceae bacterium]
MFASLNARTRALVLAVVAATTLITGPVKAEQRLQAAEFAQLLLADTCNAGGVTG